MHDIVRVFFEERFEAMSEEEIEDMRREILMDEREQEEARNSEAREEEELDKIMEEAAKKQGSGPTDAAPVIKKELVNLPTISEKDLNSLPENIKIEFVDENFFDEIDKDDEPVGLFDKK
jgi:hypothetical protein